MGRALYWRVRSLMYLNLNLLPAHPLDLSTHNNKKLLKPNQNSNNSINSIDPEANSMTVFHLNILDLNTKHIDLHKYAPHLFFLTEHGVSPDNLPLTNIPGYKQLPAFSRTEHKGGGQ